MIVELAHYALILALLLALAQAGVGLIGAQRRDGAWMNFTATLAHVQFLALGLAFAGLMHAYLVSDFSVANVARNSHTEKPLLYKISGVWGNHEGSLLLWALVLALFGAAVAVFGRHLLPTLKARVLGVQGLIGAGFTAFILATSNPFLRLDPAPMEGNGLNPLLQDPGLAFHPPFLYLGYVGYSLTFSFAVAALIEGRVDAAWARWVRPWALAAWAALTLGIGLGSWWAYYTLGWGGWWYWDPVENASFMPWLLGTALLHSAIVVEKRDALKRWTILLAILTFGLCLIGTFLVRSGVITSVHSFASDPARGVMILLLLAAAMGSALGLYAWRAPKLEAGGLFAPLSREGALVLNNLLLATACATVLIGTLYPMFMDALGGDKLSVGPPFFQKTFVPLMVPLVLAMAVGPLLGWKRGDLLAALKRLWVAGAVSVFAIALAWGIAVGGPVLAPFAVGLAVWLMAGALLEFFGRLDLRRGPAVALARLRGVPRAAWGMFLAHFGCGLAILGMTGSLWTAEQVQFAKIGDTIRFAGYELRFEGVETLPVANYRAERGRFTVSRNGQEIWTLRPEKRLYTAPPMPITDAAIRTTGFADLYVVLGDKTGDGDGGGWTVRLYYEPLIPFLWGGVGLMVIGGLVSLADRRLRVGAPVRRRQPLAAQAAE